jgi:hypothetical protein
MKSRFYQVCTHWLPGLAVLLLLLAGCVVTQPLASQQPTTEFDTIGGQVGPDSYYGDDPQVAPGKSYLLVLVEGINAQMQAD